MLYKLIYDLAKYNNKNLYLFSNKIKKYNLNYLIEHYGIIKKNTYNKNILYRNDNFEIILISWDKNICTNIHRHPENGCIMNILDGCLKEEITCFSFFFIFIFSLSFFSFFSLNKNDFKIKMLSSADGVFSFRILVVFFLFFARHWSVNSEIL